jgi:peptide/nickel transport system permease protein
MGAATSSTGSLAPAETPTPTGPARVKGRRPSPQIAQLRRTLYFLRRNTLALIGLGILLFMVAVALYSPFYPAPGDTMTQLCSTAYGSGVPPNTTAGCLCTYIRGVPPPQPGCIPVDGSFESEIAPTVSLHPLSLGPLPFGSLTVAPSQPYYYNLFAGLIKGAPWSLGIAASVVIAGSMIGLLLGSLAGYEGGYVDETIMRFTDIFLSIPGLLLLIVILAAVGSVFSGLAGRLGLLLLAYIITDWPIYTRIVRGQVLVTREQKYVEAAKASGAGGGRILTKHIIPNSMYPVFVQMSLDVGTIPLSLGALVFLGFNIFPAQYFPEWGNITAHSVNIGFIQYIFTYCGLPGVSCIFPWWQIFLPGLTLFFFALSVNFLSDGLRDALDPRLRR